MAHSVKRFFEISEDMVMFLLKLKVVFTQDSKVEIFSALNSACSAIMASTWGLSLFRMKFDMILLE